MESNLPDALPAPLPVPNSSLQSQLLARDFASFWLRFGAALLDLLLLEILRLSLGRIVSALPLHNIPVIAVLYSVGFIAYGATPGMRAVNVRVIDGNGNPPGVKRSIVRYIIPALSWIPASMIFSSSGIDQDFALPMLIVTGIALTILGLLDPLWMIWDANKQTLHDKLASTYVVRLRAD